MLRLAAEGCATEILRVVRQSQRAMWHRRSTICQMSRKCVMNLRRITVSNVNVSLEFCLTAVCLKILTLFLLSEQSKFPLRIAIGNM